MNERKVIIGGIYRHFKGNNYRVLAIGTHTETGEEFVIYVKYPDGGNVWVRPYNAFLSEVDHDKYPDVVQKYRFEFIYGD